MLESDTKNHRTRIVVMPQIVFDDLGELFTEQALENNGADWNGLIFQRKGKPVHPNTFSHHLRRLYDRNGFPEEYHLHTMRHFFATYLLEHGTSKQVAADLLGHADTAFWNEPTAIRRISAKRKLPGCLILCWHRQRKNTTTLCRTNIPRAMSPGFLFVRYTTVRIFPFGRILTIGYVRKLWVFCPVCTSIVAVLRWVW